MAQFEGHLGIINALQDQINELDRRLRRLIVPVKVTDIDADGSRTGTGSPADGEQRCRVNVGFTPQNDGEESTLSTWVRYFTSAQGNVSIERPPSPGELGCVFNPGGNEGLHSFFMPGTYSTQDGEKVDSVKYPPVDKKADRYRRVVHVTKEQNETTLKAERTGVGAPEPNSTKCQKGKPDYINSYCCDSDSEDVSIVVDDQSSGLGSGQQIA